MRGAKVVLALLLAAGISIGGALIGERWVASRGASDPDSAGPIARLDRLPDFRLKDPEGAELASAAWSGKVLVVNFWATWCRPCEREAALLARAQAALGPRGVQVVGIAYDRPADVRDFLARHPLGYPVLIATPAAMDLAQGLGNLTQETPFTAIFDRDGRLVFSQAGEMPEGALQAELDRLTWAPPDT